MYYILILLSRELWIFRLIVGAIISQMASDSMKERKREKVAYIFDCVEQKQPNNEIPTMRWLQNAD
jgi:hypothetical protein